MKNRERERNSKRDRVNKFTLTVHIYIWTSLATHGAFGTMVSYAMSCSSNIRNHLCCMLYNYTSIKPNFMSVLVFKCFDASVCMYT